MSGAGRKPEGVAVALPYLVTLRSRMLVQRSQAGAATDDVRPPTPPSILYCFLRPKRHQGAF